MLDCEYHTLKGRFADNSLHIAYFDYKNRKIM